MSNHYFDHVHLGGPVCPGCGKTLPLRATICLDCNLNVLSGRPLPVPIVPGGGRTPSIWGVFGLVLMLGVFGYANRNALHEMLFSSSLQSAAADPIESFEIPAVVPTLPDVTALARDTVREPIPEKPVAEPPRTRAEAVAATTVRPVALTEKVVAVQCDLCRGAGRIPREGSLHTTYRCPACHGNGGRERRLRAGQRLCGECRGMGQIGRMGDLFRTRNHYVADRCKTCRGSGLLRD